MAIILGFSLMDSIQLKDYCAMIILCTIRTQPLIHILGIAKQVWYSDISVAG